MKKSNSSGMKKSNSSGMKKVIAVG